MIRTLPIVSAVLFGACATVQAPAPQAPSPSPAAGLSAQDVAAGFAIAVVDGCVAAAEAGKTLEQLGSDKIVRDTSRSAMRLKPEFTAWAPRLGQGIVTIDEGAESCDVSAYGAPVQSTFDAIARALGDVGYQTTPVPSQGYRHFATSLSKAVEGRMVSVLLIGNEPGAAGTTSRFSGLSAFVTVKKP